MVAGSRMGHGSSWLYRDELLFQKNRLKRQKKKTQKTKKQASCSTSFSLGDQSVWGDWIAKGVQNRIQIRLTVELVYPHTGWQSAKLGLRKGNSELSPPS